MTNLGSGFYTAGTSVLHRMDARMKLTLCLAYLVSVLAASTPAALLICALYLAAALWLGRITPAAALRCIAPLLIVVLLTVIINLLCVSDGTELFSQGFIHISTGGVQRAAFMAMRLTLLLTSVAALTLTTPLLDISDGMENMLQPFARFGFPAHECGMIMGLALRFLPQFATEAADTYRAQLSRGARLSFNPFKGGLHTFTALLVPLFTSAFRHAEALSCAMDARCYHGGAGRTRLHPFALGKRDAYAAVLTALLLMCVIAANLLF